MAEMTIHHGSDRTTFTIQSGQAHIHAFDVHSNVDVDYHTVDLDEAIAWTRKHAHHAKVATKEDKAWLKATITASWGEVTVYSDHAPVGSIQHQRMKAIAAKTGDSAREAIA